jgi:pimeloyl-ACP methyl ester carboxylesterase
MLSNSDNPKIKAGQMSDAASIAVAPVQGQQSYYQRAIDGLKSVAAHLSNSVLPSSVGKVTAPMKALLHWASDLASLERYFLQGSTLDGSNRYTKQSLQLKHIEPMFTPGLSVNTELLRTANENIPALEQFKIEPLQKHGPYNFTFFSGIRTSAFYKLDGAIKFAQAGIPCRLGDYTGFGASYGQRNITTNDLIADTKLKLRDQLIQSKRADSFCHSLGGSLATRALAELSEEHELRAGSFIGVSTWNDFDSVVAEVPSIMFKPFTPLVRKHIQTLIEDKFDTAKNLCRVIDNIVNSYRKSPPRSNEVFEMIIVHGLQDNHVAPKHSNELVTKVQEHIKNSVPQEWQSHFKLEHLTIPNAGHFTTKFNDGVIPYDQILGLLQQYPKTNIPLSAPQTVSQSSNRLIAV